MEQLCLAYDVGVWHVKHAQSNVCYRLSGRLYASQGRVLLQVPRKLLHGAVDALNVAGARLPTPEEAPLAIEVISPGELSRLGGPANISERGHSYHYTLSRIREDETAAGESFWWFQVHSPDLAALRTSYGLPALPPGGFRLVFAYRPAGVLQPGPTSKLLEASVPPHHDDPFWPISKTAATGIANRRDYGELTKLPLGELVDFVVQHHLAQRAGPHYDIRFGTPALGLFSWASRRKMPRPGERIAIFRQPIHDFPYKDFEGTLRGYGAGTVRRHEAGQALITKISPDAVHFTLGHRVAPERFVALHPQGWKPNDWLLLNITRRVRPDVEKPKYPLLDASQAETIFSQLQEGTSVQPKIDGASTIVDLSEDHPELYSFRISKRNELPISYTDRFFRGKNVVLKLPRQLRGTVLLGELYGVRQMEDGTEQVIPVEELSGLLNARLARSLEAQKARAIDLRVLFYDVAKGPGGKPPPADRAERVRLMQEVIRHLPEGKFGLMPEARTRHEALALWQQIVSGKHPLTREGVVIYPPRGTPSKLKARQEMDVYIRNIFRGSGKYSDTAGGFEYSLEPDGPIVGRVGTGMSDELRQAMWEDKDEFIGRRASISFTEQHRSGALRQPSLLFIHDT